MIIHPFSSISDNEIFISIANTQTDYIIGFALNKAIKYLYLNKC